MLLKRISIRMLYPFLRERERKESKNRYESMENGNTDVWKGDQRILQCKFGSRWKDRLYSAEENQIKRDWDFLIKFKYFREWEKKKKQKWHFSESVQSFEKNYH